MISTSTSNEKNLDFISENFIKPIRLDIGIILCDRVKNFDKLSKILDISWFSLNKNDVKKNTHTSFYYKRMYLVHILLWECVRYFLKLSPDTKVCLICDKNIDFIFDIVTIPSLLMKTNENIIWMNT